MTAQIRQTLPELAIARVMRLVLDTNVVLDWLLFQDAALDPLRLAVLEGRVSLVSLAHGMDELHRVLQYPKFGLEPIRQQEVLTQYARASAPLPELTRDNVLPAGFPRCRDSDDDPFVALAYFARADALVSKDKQVLRLRKKAAKFGVVVLTPVQLITLMTAMRTNMSKSAVVDQESSVS
jgi:putative PIN family toxin of toxin-antitoxin system